MHPILYSLCFLSLLTTLAANPFKISLPINPDLSTEHYIEAQEKLRAIDINPTLDNLYPKKTPFTWPGQRPEIQKKQDFQGRMSRGIRQTLINLPEGKKPEKKLIQINKGGDCCIVSFASYDGNYTKLLEAIPETLKKTGFNGFFLSMTGGFPNPTGKEIQYSGVPYCFKIFALLEAEKLGFSKVLWIDAAFLPLKNPEPLFDWIEKNGCFFQSKKNAKRYLLPATREILLKETGSDMYETPCIRARIIGLDLKTQKAKDFIQDYYALVELGTPFISCFPEEFVIGALLAKKPSNWPFETFTHLVMNERKLQGKNYQWAQESGYFFLLQEH